MNHDTDNEDRFDQAYRVALAVAMQVVTVRGFVIPEQEPPSTVDDIADERVYFVFTFGDDCVQVMVNRETLVTSVKDDDFSS